MITLIIMMIISFFWGAQIRYVGHKRRFQCISVGQNNDVMEEICVPLSQTSSRLVSQIHTSNCQPAKWIFPVVSFQKTEKQKSFKKLRQNCTKSYLVAQLYSKRCVKAGFLRNELTIGTFLGWSEMEQICTLYHYLERSNDGIKIIKNYFRKRSQYKRLTTQSLLQSNGIVL